MIWLKSELAEYILSIVSTTRSMTATAFNKLLVVWEDTRFFFIDFPFSLSVSHKLSESTAADKFSKGIDIIMMIISCFTLFLLLRHEVAQVWTTYYTQFWAPAPPRHQADGHSGERTKARAGRKSKADEQRRQTKTEAETAAETARETERLLEELWPERDALDAAARMSAAALLRHIFRCHPPRRLGSHAAEADAPANYSDAASARRGLLKAVLAYHEDKNPAWQHGLKWYVLCREITWRLNSQLEHTARRARIKLW